MAAMTQEAKMLSGLGIITIVVLGLGVFFLSKTQPGVTTPSVVGEDTSKLLVRSDSHATTKTSTKVTIVEFADFECPVCATSYPVIEKLRNTYKDQITFVYRYFPLPQHTWARDTAYAAEAAGMQGKFWEMYALLYAKQNEWTDKNEISSVLTTYAKSLQLDVQKFQSDMKSKSVVDHVNEDLTDGTSLGVNATPTFFINGEKFVGVPNEQELAQKIDAILKK